MAGRREASAGSGYLANGGLSIRSAVERGMERERDKEIRQLTRENERAIDRQTKVQQTDGQTEGSVFRCKMGQTFPEHRHTVGFKILTPPRPAPLLPTKEEKKRIAPTVDFRVIAYTSGRI